MKSEVQGETRQDDQANPIRAWKSERSSSRFPQSRVLSVPSQRPSWDILGALGAWSLKVDTISGRDRCCRGPGPGNSANLSWFRIGSPRQVAEVRRPFLWPAGRIGERSRSPSIRTENRRRQFARTWAYGRIGGIAQMNITVASAADAVRSDTGNAAPRRLFGGAGSDRDA